MCKMKIFLGVFSIFSKLTFPVMRRVKGQKMVQIDKKNSETLHISGSVHHIIMIFGTRV